MTLDRAFDAWLAAPTAFVFVRALPTPLSYAVTVPRPRYYQIIVPWAPRAYALWILP